MRKGHLRKTLQQAGKNVKATAITAAFFVSAILLPKAVLAQTTNFSYTGTIVSYTVPVGVTTATITCNGAQGGNSTSPAQSGGLGAIMSGVFVVTPGHVLNILVGQQPTSCQYNAGGGGGSFVWDVTASNTLLIAAGGGGGANGNVGSGVNGLNASTGTSGVLGGNATGGAGTGGNGASNPTGSNFWGGGGAGWLTNGANGTTGGCALLSTGGTKPLSGGAGGAQGGTNISPPNGNGGFGGGGGGQGLCGNTGGAGGGGGYSGGTSGTVPNATQAQPGGGGGSFNSGSSQSNSVGQSGNGSVSITVPSISPITVTSISPAIANANGTASVAITGTGFNSTTTNDAVSFSGMLGTVTSATTTSLNVTVPTGAMFGPVTVGNTTTGLSAGSLASFLPTWPGPASTIAFDPRADYNNAGLAGIAIGDLDGDGKTDIVVTAQGSNIVQVYRNVSTSGSLTTSSFSSAVNFGAGSGPAMVAIADLDGDGKPEIIASDFGSNTVAILRNTATSGTINGSSFASAVTFTVGSSPEGIAVGDIDGDGKPDLAILNQTLGTISLLQNTSTPGSLSFNPQVVIAIGGGPVPFYCQLADIDGDGKLDLIETNFNLNNFRVYLNTSTIGTINGSTFAAPLSFTANSQTIGLAVADIDGDGKQDVVVSNFGSSNFSVFRNLSTVGSVSFAAKVDISSLGAPIQLGVCDFNGDGKPDIVMGRGSSGTSLSVFPNTSTSGSVSFGTRLDAATGFNPEWIAVGDLDGDGKPDVAAVNVSGVTGTSVIRNSSALNNAPTYTAASPQTLSVCQNSINNDFSSLLQVNDLDVGQTETFTLNSGPSHGSVTIGGTVTSTGGNVTPAGYKYTPNTSYSGPDAFVIQVSDGVGGTAIMTIDVTVNATPVPITGPTVVCIGSTITLNNTSGGGTWTSASPGIATVGSGSGVVTGVSSGNVTIIYTLPGNCSVTQTVDVSPIPTVTSVSPTSGIPGTSVTITGTNFNTSSANDYVYFGSVKANVTSASSTTLNVTIPNGGAYYPVVSVENNSCALTGWAQYPFLPTYNNAPYVTNTVNFAIPVVVATGSFPNHSSYGDIDGDGLTDIVVSNFSSGTTTVYRNTSTSGNVSFAAPVTVATVTASSSGTPSVGDIDGDGLLDVIVMSVGSGGQMLVARNTSTPGTISFASPVSFSFPGANASAIADIDGDGKLDVLGSTGSTLSIFRNTSSVGSVSFAARVNFAAAGTIGGITAGNLDGDTKPDIAAAVSNGANSLSIFRNLSTPGTISLAVRQDIATVNVCSYVALADMDGDGLQDVLTTNSGSTTFSIFPNTSTVGSISFGSRSDVASGTNPAHIGVGDFNGDGKPDVTFGAVSSGVVQVFQNTSTGVGVFSVASVVNFTSGSQPAGMTVSDIDGDGLADIAVTNQGANTISVYRNNPLRAITGTLTTCPGATTTLSDATAGGTWSSSNPAIGSVGSSTGVVTGVSAGTVNITYMGTAQSGPALGNYTVTTVTVNTNPAGITGATNICTGNTTTLNDATAGGTWSSSNGAIGTVGSATGVVGGVAGGVVNISYTLTATGCYATTPFTVNQTPTPISGTFTTCIGRTTTLTDGYSGGTWTSLSPAIGTVGSATGIVTGIAAGTTTIVYTMPGNCTTSQAVTVNSNPNAITGLSTVCVGSNTTLSNSTAGGTWSSSAPSIASVGPGTGTVIGASAGTLTITYTLATGCFSTFPMTVNPLPAAITGTMNVCVGLSTTLADATAGGTWSSSNPAIGSVSGATVTGVSAGTITITYALPTGCIATTPFTVNALPAAISGASGVCVGLTTMLTDVTGTGTWSSSNPAIGSIGSVSGVVTGVSAGTINIVYTLPTGCTNTKAFTVNANPAAITGTFTACPGTSATLSDATGGGTWASNNPATATIAPTGTYTGIAAGTSTITYTVTATGCIATTLITINPNPAAITGTPVVCVSSTTTLADASGGGTWSSSIPAQGSIVAGTGVMTGVAAGNPVITYTLPTGCIATTPSTVNPLPVAITGSNNVCVGSTTTLTDGSGVSTWSSSNTALATIGTSSGVVTGVAAGNLNITFTLPTGCFVTMPFTVNITPAAIAGTPNVCVGLNRTLTDGTSGGTWSSSNPAIGSVGSTTGVVTGVSAGTMNIIYTLPAGSCTATTPFTVNIQPVAIVGATTVCTGATTTLTDASGASTWSSSNTGIASVGSGSGVVSGISAGTATITFTLSAGNCFVTSPMTVNQTPSANTGATTVCVGLNTTLANSTSGGTWSSSNPAIGSVVPATGVVTGVSAGNMNITYTLPTGCFAVTPMTVNPQPVSIVGATTVCTGTTTTLTDASGVSTWSSSNNAVATVGSGSGVVSGISAGTVTITFTLPAGCFVTQAMTVNQTPLAITGSNILCTGQNTTLSDGTGGGTWSSSNPAVGSIVPATGVATGVSTGTATISYIMPTGCFATLPVTVNTQPSAITGTFTVCTGASTTLSSAPGGGTWTSSNPALGSVGSTTGVVTGVSAGTPTISYTLAGCTATQPVTVNTTPAAIAGNAPVCVNSTIILTDASPGGTWSSSNTALGSIGSTSGILTGVGAGNPSIIYTLPGGCTATVTATVNAQPTAFAVTGGGAYCAGSPGVHIGLSTSSAGVSYQVWRGLTAVGSPLSGTGLSLDFGLFTTAGTYTVIGTVTATGCTQTMSGSAVVSINPLPTIFNLTGGGAYCTGGSGFHIILSGSDPVGSISYQLYINGIPSGVPFVGTGTLLDYGFQTTAGTYTVIATNPTTGCTNTMNGAPVISILPLPNVYAVTGGGGYCAGALGVNVGLAASDIGISYQLFVTGVPTGVPLAGTGASLNFGLQTTGGAYTVVGTNVATGCVNTMSGSVTVTINPLPTVFAVTGGGGYCAGGTGVNVGLSGSTVGVTYSLFRGVTLVTTAGGTGLALNFGLQTTAGTYTVVAQSGAGCTSNMSGSATVTINPLPPLFSMTGGGAYCSGGAGVNVGLSGSTIGVSYQLFNGGPVGGPIVGTGLALNFGLQTVIGTYTVVGTNSTTGCVNTMSGSSVVSINILPNAYVVSGTAGYCTGGTGVPVTLSSSDLGILYQLYNGISPVGAPLPGTGALLNFGLQTAAGTYTVIATNPGTGCTNVMTGSAVVTINPLPTVFAVTGGGAYCAGGTGVPVGVSGSTVGVNYQLFINGGSVGVPVGGTGSPLSFGLQTLTGPCTVVATDAVTGCTNNMSSSVVISTNPLPVVYSVTGGGSYCVGGTGVHVGLAASNIGINYQLYYGVVTSGGLVAGTGAALDFGLLTGVGTYTVSATNAVTGCTASMAGSATVSTTTLPATYTVGGGGSYCAGGTGMAVTLSSSDVGISYQLYNGGTPTGAPLFGSTLPLNFGLQTAAGTYTVVATNTGTGCTSNMTGSVVVSINPLPNVYTVTGGGGYCTGGSGVMIGLSNSQTGINYQLLNPGPVGGPVAGTGFPLTFGPVTLGATYTITATNPVTTCASNMTGSALVSINPLPIAFPMTGGGSYCAGGTGVPVGLLFSSLGVNYQLYNGATPIGVPMPGTTGPIAFGLQTLPGTYTIKGTDAVTGCVQTMVGSAIVSINALPTVYAITGGGSYCPGGAGVAVGLNNSDPGTSYQLMLGGTPVGGSIPGSGTPISFGPQTTLGTYTVVANNGCTANMSGSVTVSNYPLPNMHMVTGGGSYCAGGTGVAVSLNGSDAGILYQLEEGGSTVGLPLPGTGSPLNFGLQTTAGIYTVVATNAVTGCVDTMLDSASININPLPLVQTITGGGNYCIGGTGVDIALGGSELGVSYQLYNGTTPIGSPVAGTGAGLDFGLFTAAGVYTIAGINTTTLCSSTMAGSDTISINPLPTAYTVTGGGNYCAGGIGEHVGLSNTQNGVNYQLYNGATMVGSSVPGTGSPIDFGLQTVAGIYTVRAVNATTGCTNNMLSSATVAINALPIAYNMTGGGGYCTGGSGVAVGLSGSNSGIAYQLYNGSTIVGTPQAGTGSSLTYGIITTPGTYYVVARNVTTGCMDTMSGSAVVVINPLPTVHTVTGSATSYCSGGAGINVYLSTADAGVSYQLYRGTTPVGLPVMGTGGAYDFGPQTIAGLYTVVATNATTLCTSTMSGSASVSINPPPAAYNVIGGGSYCPGGAGVHVGLSNSNIGVRYQLYHDLSAIGTPINGSGTPIDFGLQTATGNYTVVATIVATGCTSNMTGSATVAVNPLPLTYTMTGGGSFCAGGIGVNVGLSGSVSGTNYQLYYGPTPIGGPVAGTGIAINFGLQTTAGTYTVVASDAVTGCQSNMAGSAIVNVNTLPMVYMVTGGGNYCPGGSGVHINLTGSESGVNYQLYLGATAVGGPVAGTGSGIDFGLQTATGTYTVVASNGTTSCMRNMSGSVAVGLYAVPSTHNVVGGGSYCAGGTGVHVGLDNSTPGVSYQLYNGTGTAGPAMPGTGSPIDFGAHTDSGIYTVVAINTTTGCTSNMAGSATVRVNAIAVPTITISAGGSDTVCRGDYATYTAVVTNEGALPAYQWTVNGAISGSANSFSYIPTDGDIVGVTLLSSAICATPATVSSSVTVPVLPKLMPVVGIEATPGVIICKGSTVTFTATPTNGGSSPTYLWKKNGLSAGTNPTFTDVPVDGDLIYCELTSSYYCRLANTVQSSHVTMEVDTPIVPVVTLSVNPGTDVYTGETVTVTAHLSNTVPYPIYKWYVNGVLVGSVTTPQLINDTYQDGDIITCEVLSGGGCPAQTGSATLSLHVMNVGVKPVSLSGSDIRLMPNPNKGTFTVKGSLGTNMDEEVAVEITDMLGQVIYTAKVHARNGEINERIQLDKSIANGMYILSLHAGGENKVFHVVVEQ